MNNFTLNIQAGQKVLILGKTGSGKSSIAQVLNRMYHVNTGEVLVDGKPIEFPEWGYLGMGKFQRRDFRYDALTQRSSIHGTLFELFEEHQLFVPTTTHLPMGVEELAK